MGWFVQCRRTGFRRWDFRRPPARYDLATEGLGFSLKVGFHRVSSLAATDVGMKRSRRRGKSFAKPAIMHAEAVRDMRDGAKWYDERHAGLGDEFLALIDDALHAIESIRVEMTVLKRLHHSSRIRGRRE